MEYHKTVDSRLSIYLQIIKRKMKYSETSSGRIAKIISTVTNPPVLSVLVLFLISFTKSSGMLLLAGWWIEVLIFLVLLPIVYIYMRSFIAKKTVLLPKGVISYMKQHPSDVLIMGVIFGIPCLVILLIFGAPVQMCATMGALLVIALIIASVYRYYRISYHVAAIIVLVTMVIITWGAAYSGLAILVPAAGWAKYRLKEHSIAQIGLAAAVAAVVLPISILVFVII